MTAAAFYCDEAAANCRDDFLCVTVELDLVPRARDSAIRTDEERLALRRYSQDLLRPIRRDDALLRIGDHREGQTEFVDEPLLHFGLVRTHAHHEGAEGFQSILVLLEILRFVRSTRRVGSRIEVDNDPLAALVAQVERFAPGGGGDNRRSAVTFSGHLFVRHALLPLADDRH